MRQVGQQCGKRHGKPCDSPDPVSYTHLDVYKRQGLNVVEMPCDETVCRDVIAAAERIGVEPKRGLVVSGDQFIASKEKIDPNKSIAGSGFRIHRSIHGFVPAVFLLYGNSPENK